MGYAEAMEEQLKIQRYWGSTEGLSAAQVIKKYNPSIGLSDATIRLALFNAIQGAAAFFVAAPLCDLLNVGGLSLPDYNLMEAYLPEQSGWMFFEKPLAIGDKLGIRGFNWSRNAFGVGSEPGIGIAVYIDERLGGPQSFLIGTVLNWDFGQPWTLATSKSLETEKIMSIFAGFLMFMHQRILVASSRPVGNRQARKRLMKQMDHMPLVHVVELRRREYQQRDESQDVPIEWSCQWLVRSHWHRYHTKNGVKLIFTKPYVKGDPTKPLKAPTITAYEVVR